MAGCAFCLYFVMIFDFEVSKEIQNMKKYIARYGDENENPPAKMSPGDIELNKNQEPLFNNNDNQQI